MQNGASFVCIILLFSYIAFIYILHIVPRHTFILPCLVSVVAALLTEGTIVSIVRGPSILFSLKLSRWKSVMLQKYP